MEKSLVIFFKEVLNARMGSVDSGSKNSSPMDTETLKGEIEHRMGTERSEKAVLTAVDELIKNTRGKINTMGKAGDLIAWHLLIDRTEPYLTPGRAIMSALRSALIIRVSQLFPELFPSSVATATSARSQSAFL